MLFGLAYGLRQVDEGRIGQGFLKADADCVAPARRRPAPNDVGEPHDRPRVRLPLHSDGHHFADFNGFLHEQAGAALR